MKKTIIFKTLATVFLTAALFFAGCKSTKTEIPENEVQLPESDESTFVNTACAANGEFYTGFVFARLTKVQLIDQLSGLTDDIDIEDISYDKSTTVIKINGFFPALPDQYVMHVEGRYTVPPRFILYDNSKYEPLVMYSGKKIIKDKDYTYDEKTKLVEFNFPADLNSDSYKICWLATDGIISSIVNADHPYKKIYSQLEKEWLSSMQAR
ncbi:MAG: hypothetical protein J6Z17_00930 [Treponema sp.]|nr:hypothetical protein [Treponema sp.]